MNIGTPKRYAAGGKRTATQSIVTVILLCLFGAAPSLWAQSETLSLQEALSAAREHNPGIRSANWDWPAAQAKADAASFRMFPSLSLSASYQRLSELPPGRTY